MGTRNTFSIVLSTYWHLCGTHICHMPPTCYPSRALENAICDIVCPKLPSYLGEEIDMLIHVEHIHVFQVSWQAILSASLAASKHLHKEIYVILLSIHTFCKTYNFTIKETSMLTISGISCNIRYEL